VTEEQIKEALSLSFMEAIAHRNGYKCEYTRTDHGVDLRVSEVAVLPRNGKTRLLDSGRSIQLQLKCTCEASVDRLPDKIKYDLEAKTYNDLIDRRTLFPLVPLYLVVLVLPDISADWLVVAPDQLILRRTAFWYLPSPAAGQTDNKETQRIEIPVADSVGLDFFQRRFAEAYP
jgi:hypothetical protein